LLSLGQRSSVPLLNDQSGVALIEISHSGNKHPEGSLNDDCSFLLGSLLPVQMLHGDRSLPELQILQTLLPAGQSCPPVPLQNVNSFGVLSNLCLHKHHSAPRLQFDNRIHLDLIAASSLEATEHALNHNSSFVPFHFLAF
jgi:hypothetical protein